MKIIEYLFKATRKVFGITIGQIYTPIAQIVFFLNGVKIDKGLTVRGFIKVIVTRRGKLTIGKNLRINSGNNYNLIGRQQKCIFWVEGTLNIGDNLRMSSSAIICKVKITIGNNVTIGGNNVIYDTDFHSLNPVERFNSNLDNLKAKNSPVIIKDNVFIGAHSTILKGVSIGENSIIGACSVITKSIPPNEIWAGNPACFIKKIGI